MLMFWKNKISESFFNITKLGLASSGGSRENIGGRGGWPIIIWEATTVKRNYYRTNYEFGGLGKIWGAHPPAIA